MKNVKRILMLVLAVTLIAACMLTVAVSAAPAEEIYAGSNTSDSKYISEYLNSTVYRDDSFETQFTVLPYFGSGNTTYFTAERTKFADENVVRKGASNIYSDNPTNMGFLTFDYGELTADTVKGKPARYYATLVFATMTGEITPVNGYVMEFDFGVFSRVNDNGTPDDPSDDTTSWEFPSYLDTAGNSADGEMQIEMLTSGTAKDTNAAGQQLYAGLMTIEQDYNTPENDYRFVLRSGMGQSELIPGDTWVHVTWVYDADNYTFAMYIGDDDTGRKLIGYHQLWEGLYPVNFRVGGCCSYGQMSFDNFLSYTGTEVHNPKYIESMSSVKRFGYLSECAADDTIPYGQRYTAITAAAALYDKDPAINNSSDIQVQYDVEIFKSVYEDEAVMEALITATMLENAAVYNEKMQEIRAMPRTLANASARTAKLAAARVYLNSVTGLIDLECNDYKEANRLAITLEAEINRDNAAVSFITEMERFAACEELGFSNSMRTHYENAGEYKSNTEPPSSYTDDNPESSTSLYKRFVKAWSDYEASGVILDGVEQRLNANRFVELVSILLERKDTWFTDDGTCRRLWTNARQILDDNHYDASATVGFEDAYEQFTKTGGIHDSFWSYIQDEHIRVLTERLSGFNKEGVTYIERRAIITFVEHYVSTNSDFIDDNNTEVARLALEAENYKKDLAELEADYKELLQENSQKFIDLIKLIKEKKTYAEIMELLPEATQCYYSMDIPDDVTMEAVIYYEELVKKLDRIATDSAIFKDVASRLASAENEDEMYALLTSGYACLEYIDESIEGVTEAKTTYFASYDAYMGEVNTHNGELSSATDIVTSVRAYCGLDAIVDYVTTILE